MAKRIICIHGLASKPPRQRLQAFWENCIAESLRLQGFGGPVTEDALRQAINVVYWADQVPSHLPDSDDYCDALEDRIAELMQIRATKGDGFHMAKKWKLSTWLKSELVGFANVMSEALTIKDDVVEKTQEEVRLYQNDQYVADAIRSPLIDAITNAWDNNDEVMVLSHSMGTFIAYDVLWQLSHRTQYSMYHGNRIRRLVTMGSPLGDDYIQGLLFGDRYRKEYRRYPGNIDSWINFSSYGDVVCHDSTLEDDFMKPMVKDGMLPTAADAFRDYVDLYNPFQTVSGKANPHKSYGYLVQPKLAQWIRNFMED